MAFPIIDRAVHESDETAFEAHLVSNILASLSQVAVLGAEDYHIRTDRRDSFVEVKLKPGSRSKKVHYVLLQVGADRASKFKHGPQRLTDGLRLVIADVVKATVEEIGVSGGLADPALERLTHVIARSLPSARRMVSEATIEKMVDALVETQDPIAQVSAAIDADNARARHRFIGEVKTLTAEEVASSFGSTARNRHQTASRWKADRRIFSVPWQSLERFPAFQFKEGKPVPVIADVLGALPARMTAWETAFWFVSTNGWLDGAAPRERLNDPTRLLEAARLEGETVAG